MIEIILHPYRPPKGRSTTFRSKRTGKLVAKSLDLFVAELPDGERLPHQRVVIFGTARILQARGYAPETVLAFRHVGSPIIAARGQIGELAKWTIVESDRGGLQKKLWQPYQRGELGELEDEDETGGFPLARDGENRGRSMQELPKPGNAPRPFLAPIVAPTA